ncbi:MAG TPA: type II toxin-antitoxin system VapC family toxin [Thermoanaerobaculia bacterium]|nr:type II toxin-antitoxin system VapC family toxin [Thermoanaerobaculia bacterium]
MALSRYCLDTSAYSQFKRGHAPVVELIDRAEWLGFPSIALGELWLGFVLGQLAERNQHELREFLSHPLVEELPVDRGLAPIYAEIVKDLRRAGTPLPINDIWIAATAALAGVPVLTYDSHFRSIRQIDSIILQPA